MLSGSPMMKLASGLEVEVVTINLRPCFQEDRHSDPTCGHAQHDEKKDEVVLEGRESAQENENEINSTGN